MSFSEGLDFTTTTGKLLYQIISAFAEFERDCIRERVLAEMRNARAKGKRNSLCGRKIYGGGSACAQCAKLIGLEKDHRATLETDQSAALEVG